MMKKTSPTKTTKTSTTKATVKVVAKKKVVTAVRKRVVTKRVRSPLSKVSMYGRRTLRDILLSRALHALSKVFVVAFITCTALYGMYSFASNTFAGDVVISKSEIVSRVGKLATLPDETPDKVVRVQDAETLKKQNAFFENVKEGDYIIMYPSLAIIYSLRTDSIVGIKKNQ